ncbi:hypothetical protein D3C79_583380 [compost metagenome]
MQHLGAEGGHLGRLHEADFGDGAGPGDQARIRGVDAGHVCPDLYAACVQCLGEQGRAVVGAAPAQCGGAAIGVGADEALGDDEAVTEQRAQGGLAEGAGGGEIHGGLAKAAVGAQQLARVLPAGLDAPLVQQFGEEAGGHQLAAGDEAVCQFGIGVLAGLAGHGADLAELGVNERAHFARVAERRQYGLLDPGQLVELGILPGFVQFTLGQAHQQVGDPGAGAQYHHPGRRIGQHHVGAMVHGRGIGDTGSAKLGDVDRVHCILLSQGENPVSSGKREEEAENGRNSEGSRPEALHPRCPSHKDPAGCLWDAHDR